MKRVRLVIVLCVAVLLTGPLYYFYGGSQSPAGQHELIRLSAANFGELKREFNGSQGRVRVIALLSPT